MYGKNFKTTGLVNGGPFVPFGHSKLFTWGINAAHKGHPFLSQSINLYIFS